LNRALWNDCEFNNLKTNSGKIEPAKNVEVVQRLLCTAHRIHRLWNDDFAEVKNIVKQNLTHNRNVDKLTDAKQHHAGLV